MTEKETFFKQFPNGCPSCGGPRRRMTFTSLVKKPRGFLASIPWLSMMGMAGGEHSHFAECEISHEAFVYQQHSNRWVNADKVRKSRRLKGKTTKGQGRAHDKKDEFDIGRVY